MDCKATATLTKSEVNLKRQHSCHITDALSYNIDNSVCLLVVNFDSGVRETTAKL